MKLKTPKKIIIEMQNYLPILFSTYIINIFISHYKLGIKVTNVRFNFSFLLIGNYEIYFDVKHSIINFELKRMLKYCCFQLK